METLLTQGRTIDAEAVRRALLRRATIPSRFRFELDTGQAEELLRGCYMAMVEYRGMVYSEDENIRKALHEVAEYLTTPAMGKFGMMLCGMVGNGKTTMLKALNQATKCLSGANAFDGRSKSFQLVTAKDLLRGLVEIRPDCELLAIDDLGEESVERLEYGTVLTPIVDLLERRYNERAFTVITTNLTPQEIGDKYGRRIRDRLREMMHKIDFKRQTSYRK